MRPWIRLRLWGHRHLIRLQKHRPQLIMAAVGGVLIVGLVAAAASTMWITRQAELDRASKELGRISLVLGEYTAQIFQGADLVLEGIEQRLAVGEIKTVEEFWRRATTEDVHRLLHDKIRDVPQVNVLAI